MKNSNVTPSKGDVRKTSTAIIPKPIGHHSDFISRAPDDLCPAMIFPYILFKDKRDKFTTKNQHDQHESHLRHLLIIRNNWLYVRNSLIGNVKTLKVKLALSKIFQLSLQNFGAFSSVHSVIMVKQF